VELGARFQTEFPLWGRLGVELAADAGPRWGEQFQLTAHDVVVKERPCKKGKPRKPKIHLRIDWQIDPDAKAGTVRRKWPKGNKRRKAGVSEISITGFALHTALLARRDAALREQAAGSNPEALLFPTHTGEMFFYTSFSNDYFAPAALAATGRTSAGSGWPTSGTSVPTAGTGSPRTACSST
jgi:hypothetical protein